jgi:hypothetical protein
MLRFRDIDRDPHGVFEATLNLFIGRCLRWRCVRYTSVLSGATTPFQTYHGSEFTSGKLLEWSGSTDVELHFIEPGKPNGTCQAV